MKKIQLTREQHLKYEIATQINRWMNENGYEVPNQNHYLGLDRVCDITHVIQDGIDNVQDCWKNNGIETLNLEEVIYDRSK